MTKAILVAAFCAALASSPATAQAPNARSVGREVSVAEIERTLRAIDVDRTAGSDGERAAAEYPRIASWPSRVSGTPSTTAASI